MKLKVFKMSPRESGLLAFQLINDQNQTATWPPRIKWPMRINSDSFIVPNDPKTYAAYPIQIRRLMPCLLKCDGIKHTYCRLHPNQIDLWLNEEGRRRPVAVLEFVATTLAKRFRGVKLDPATAKLIKRLRPFLSSISTR